MSTTPFYAVRITLNHADGSTSTRDYVRNSHQMSKVKFTAFALGDMLMLTDSNVNVSWTITELSFGQVVENRKYHHTTHTEG